MSEIKKYSKEWFVTNRLPEKQEKAIREVNNGTRIVGGGFESDTLTGSVEKIKAKLTNNSDLSYSQSLFLNDVSVDNLMDILDENGDGKISIEEFNAVASTDMEEFDEDPNITLSSKDLKQIFENAVAADSAKLNVLSPGLIKYDYADGTSTIISRDKDGNVTLKIEVKGNETVGYNYTNKTVYYSKKNENGDIVEQKTDEPGRKNDTQVSTFYNDDGSKIVITKTAGTTLIDKYDNQNNVIDSSRSLNYLSDKKIGPTHQRNIGDCWLLSGINALNATEKGRQLISDAIEHHDDGSITIKLNGVNRSYTYTPDEIGAMEYDSSQKSYSWGDIDMNLFEKAVGDYRKELLSSVKTRFKMNLLDATMNDPLDAGSNTELFYYLTGQKTSERMLRSQVRDIIDKKQDNAENYAVTVSFFKKNDLVISGHAYSVNRVTEDTVYIVNPWDSGEEIAYPKDLFMKNCMDATMLDFTKLEK